MEICFDVNNVKFSMPLHASIFHLPAFALCHNMSQFNTQYEYHFGLHSGLSIKSGSGSPRVYDFMPLFSILLLFHQRKRILWDFAFFDTTVLVNVFSIDTSLADLISSECLFDEVCDILKTQDELDFVINQTGTSEKCINVSYLVCRCFLLPLRYNGTILHVMIRILGFRIL